MFETVLDPDKVPKWFIDFFIDLNVKVDLEKLQEFNVAYATEKINEVERQATCILNPSTEVIYIIAKQTTYEDPITPEIETFLFETNLNKLHGKIRKNGKKTS
jgi:hypothetical protein